MTNAGSRIFLRVLLAASLLFSLATAPRQKSSAQSTRPVLFSDASSTRAIAVDSVTRKREPFSGIAQVSFAQDGCTRLMLFAGNLRLAAGGSANAGTSDGGDESHNIHLLTVEHVGPVPDQSWATTVVLKLPADIGDVGDVLVRIFYRGQASNRVRVGIGHVGGGPPDDPEAVPTPGPIDVEFPGNPITAGTLSTDEVRTIIAQAVSAAVALNPHV